MTFIEGHYQKAVRDKMQNIAPDLMQNEYGTKIINAQEAKIFWHIAELHVKQGMTAQFTWIMFAVAALALWRSCK